MYLVLFILTASLFALNHAAILLISVFTVPLPFPHMYRFIETRNREDHVIFYTSQGTIYIPGFSPVRITGELIMYTIGGLI